MKLAWDATGEKLFEAGVDRGVLFVYGENGYENGVVWNGLQNVQISPSGGEANPQWADNIKYINMRSVEQCAGTIEAFMYPDEFAECDGSAEISTGVRIGQQRRKTFALCFRSLIGNDTDELDHGYKIHIIYGMSVNPSEKSYETVNDNPDAASFSWDFETMPVEVAEGYKPTASIEIDSTKFNTTTLEDKLNDLLDYIYGTDPAEGETGTGTASRLPMPSDIITMLS